MIFLKLKFHIQVENSGVEIYSAIPNLLIKRRNIYKI